MNGKSKMEQPLRVPESKPSILKTWSFREGIEVFQDDITNVKTYSQMQRSDFPICYCQTGLSTVNRFLEFFYTYCDLLCNIVLSSYWEKSMCCALPFSILRSYFLLQCSVSNMENKSESYMSDKIPLTYEDKKKR